LCKLAIITYIYWPITCTSNITRVLELARITYIYGPTTCTPKPQFKRVLPPLSPLHFGFHPQNLSKCKVNNTYAKRTSTQPLVFAY
jgi:hypothetical protein